MARPNLNNFRRVVVKVGSSLLIDSDAGEVRASWLAALAADLAKLHGEGRELLVINENDTVATNEIRYGDNDRLAARVATMASADLLILLSDIDGLYDAPPAGNPHAKLIPVVESVTADIEAMAGAAESELSR